MLDQSSIRADLRRLRGGRVFAGELRVVLVVSTMLDK